MANVAQYASKAMLDWVCGGASPTRPTTWAAGISLGAPTSISASEVGTASGYSCQTVTFGAAGTPSGSGTVTNANAMTFGPFSTAQSLSGVVVKDTVATGGNMLFYGTLTTARTVAAGDSLVIAAGALTITLS
jgi:hypothetical protein